MGAGYSVRRLTEQDVGANSWICIGGIDGFYRVGVLLPSVATGYVG